MDEIKLLLLRIQLLSSGYNTETWKLPIFIWSAALNTSRWDTLFLVHYVEPVRQDQKKNLLKVVYF